MYLSFNHNTQLNADPLEAAANKLIDNNLGPEPVVPAVAAHLHVSILTYHRCTRTLYPHNQTTHTYFMICTVHTYDMHMHRITLSRGSVLHHFVFTCSTRSPSVIPQLMYISMPLIGPTGMTVGERSPCLGPCAAFHLNLLISRDSSTRASSSAKCCPRQLRGPWMKGTNI